MNRTLPLLLAAIILAFPLTSFSQANNGNMASLTSGAQSLSLGCGMYTPDYLLDGCHPGKPTYFDYANKGTPEVLSLTYTYNCYKRVYIGVSLTMEQQNGNWQNNYVYDDYNLLTTTKGLFVRTSYTAAVNFTYDYFATQGFRLYMVAGVGATYEFETDQYDPDYYEQGYHNGVNIYGSMRQKNDKTHLNGYMSPLGFSVGRKFCYFLQLGFGYAGIVNTGFSYKF